MISRTTDNPYMQFEFWKAWMDSQFTSVTYNKNIQRKDLYY